MANLKNLLGTSLVDNNIEVFSLEQYSELKRKSQSPRALAPGLVKGCTTLKSQTCNSTQNLRKSILNSTMWPRVGRDSRLMSENANTVGQRIPESPNLGHTTPDPSYLTSSHKFGESYISNFNSKGIRAASPFTRDQESPSNLARISEIKPRTNYGNSPPPGPAKDKTPRSSPSDDNTHRLTLARDGPRPKSRNFCRNSLIVMPRITSSVTMGCASQEKRIRNCKSAKNSGFDRKIFLGTGFWKFFRMELWVRICVPLGNLKNQENYH
jgi:hypothetical protein